MTYPSQRKLRVCMLGLGPIAQIAHIPALIKAHNIELLAACDIEIDLLQGVVARYQIPRAYTSIEQIWADDEIEAVVIAVADHLHAPLSIAAMQSGKHVLVEKPLASTVEECKQMVDTALQTNRKLQVGCMKRFDYSLEIARRFVRDVIGQPLLINGWSYDSRFHQGYYGDYVRALILPWFTSNSQRKSNERYDDPMLHMLLGHGVHMVDLLRFFGGEIVAVTARGSQTPQLITTAIIEYASGAIGNLTLMVSAPMDWFEGLHIHGEKGSVIARIPFPYAKKLSEVHLFDANTNEYRTPTSSDLDQYERQVEAFAYAILNDLPVSPSGEDGLAAEKILYALYESQSKDGTRTIVS